MYGTPLYERNRMIVILAGPPPEEGLAIQSALEAIHLCIPIADTFEDVDKKIYAYPGVEEIAWWWQGPNGTALSPDHIQKIWRTWPHIRHTIVFSDDASRIILEQTMSDNMTRLHQDEVKSHIIGL